jgi:SAM-dependent methyltransferase
LPLETASVDAVISNCVINLSDDKAAVLVEAYRVLKTGGRVAVSDIVRAGEAPAQVSGEGWCACEDGAEDAETYRRRLAEAGFVDISVTSDAPPAGVYSARIQATKPVVRAATADDLNTVREILTASGLPPAGLEEGPSYEADLSAPA